MHKTLKVITGCAAFALLSACAMPYYGPHHHPQAQGNYVRIPPPPPQPPRKVIVRSETHRVLTPRIIMEPCCNMQPDVIYRRYPGSRY